MTGPVQDATSTRIDYELETPEVPTSNENTGILEISDDSTKAISDSRTENLKKSGVTSILKPPKDTKCDMDLEEEDLTTISIFSAARDFKQQQNNHNQAKSQKSVRFLNATPKSKEYDDGKYGQLNDFLGPATSPSRASRGEYLERWQRQKSEDKS